MNIVAYNNIIPSYKEFFQILLTFSLASIAFIFFRAENLSHAFDYLNGIFSSTIFEIPEFQGKQKAVLTICLIIIFILI